VEAEVIALIKESVPEDLIKFWLSFKILKNILGDVRGMVEHTIHPIKTIRTMLREFKEPPVKSP